MKIKMAMGVAVLFLAAQAFGQYRVVRGVTYSRTAPEWTPIRDSIEVQDVDGRVLYCKTFTDIESVRGAGGAGNAKLWPVYSKSRSYHDSFILTNYPSANRLKRGDVIRGPILVMRVDDVRTRKFSDPQLHTESNSGYEETSQITYSATLYDYGTEYIPPLAKASASGTNTPAESSASMATFNFHKLRAEEGNAGSQYRLGQLYLTGAGCQTSTNKARSWFEKAAAQGNTDAKEALKQLE